MKRYWRNVALTAAILAVPSFGYLALPLIDGVAYAVFVASAFGIVGFVWPSLTSYRLYARGVATPDPLGPALSVGSPSPQVPVLWERAGSRWCVLLVSLMIVLTFALTMAAPFLSTSARRHTP